MGFLNSLKGVFRSKTKKWKKPILLDDEKYENSGHVVHRGDEMVNAILLGKDKYETEFERYYPKSAYTKGAPGVELLQLKKRDPKTKELHQYKELQLIPGTAVFYEANARGSAGQHRRKPKLQPIHMLNRIQQADRLQKLRDKNYTLDLSEYQALLADPKTNQEAVQELRFLKALFSDAQTMNSNQLKERMEKFEKASKGLGLIGTALGAAAGIAGITAAASKAANVAANSAARGAKLSTAITDKIGKIEGLASKFYGKSSYDLLTASIGIQASTQVAAKVASMVIMGAAANLTVPGATLTALAIVTTVAKAGVNAKVQQLKKKEMQIQVNKDKLLALIDEMIENNGTIFYREDNPIFADSKVVKDKLNSILNTVENDKVLNSISTFEESKQSSAAAMLNKMMTNAADEKSDEIFENELQKLKILEKANDATLQRLLDRRMKLKRLYNTYKAPKLEKNFDTIIESQAQPQVPNAAPAARRRRNRTRRRRS